MFSDRLPSELINSNIFTGDEKVLFDLEVHQDVYLPPGGEFQIEECFFQKSPFVDALKQIICNSEVTITGSILALKEEMSQWGGLEDILDNIIYDDYTDIITFDAYEAVPGIFSVTAKISGESDVRSLQKIPTETLDMLFVEVMTDFLVVQAQRSDERNEQQ